MKEVVCHVVAHVAEDTSTVHCSSSIPIVVEDGMSEFPEWRCEDEEERRRHDEAVLVHGEVVMNAVKGEVQSNPNAIVREIAVSRQLEPSRH